jgi:hypothetical protein
MIDRVIQKYLDKLDKLRTDVDEFKEYEFELLEDESNDRNCLNRFTIGVGFFNDLRVPDDYQLIKRLFNEEVRYRNAHEKYRFDDYEYETIYMYSYFLTEFANIEDIWEFAKLKFDGSMDSYSGFETGFFLTYGKDKLRNYLKRSNHQLAKRIQKEVFNNKFYDLDRLGGEYKEGLIKYFGFKKPITCPILFFQSLNERECFLIEFEKWKKENDLTDRRIAYDYVNFAEYARVEEEIRKAKLNYIELGLEDWSSNQYRRDLRKKKSMISRLLNRYKRE